MNEELLFDIEGRRRLIFDDLSVTHYTDEIYFILPIPLPGITVGAAYSVVTNRPILYSKIRSIGVVRKRQWWALVMGLFCAPMWLYCMGVGAFTSDPKNALGGGALAFFALWLVVTGLFPLWLFYRGRPFLAIASENEMICLPMDRKKANIRRAFAILKEKVTSPEVRWELNKV